MKLYSDTVLSEHCMRRHQGRPGESSMSSQADAARLQILARPHSLVAATGCHSPVCPLVKLLREMAFTGQLKELSKIMHP